MNCFSIATLAVSALLGSISFDLSAQSLPSHPDDPTAKRIDTMQITIGLPSPLMSSSDSGASASGGSAPPRSIVTRDVRSLVVVWRTGNGRIDYTFDPAMIQCDGPAVDSYSTSDLLEMIARAAIIEGVARGHTRCTGSPDAASIIYHNSCIYRTGSGSATSFSVCSPTAFCRYAFIAGCTADDTAPMLTELPVANRCDGGGSATVSIH